MIDAHNPDRAREIERLTNERRVLGHEAGRLMRDKGLEAAQELGVSGGIVVIVDREGLLLTAESYGTARPSHAAVALDKTKTVLNYRMSSRGFGERMVELGLSRDDLAEQVGSLAGGGVGVWADPDYKEFVGAAAFSGGTTTQDEAIAVLAVERAGLYTKITPLPEGQVPLIPQQEPFVSQG
jgi:uncharacterized protein GlcG (DUF336 family)